MTVVILSLIHICLIFSLHGIGKSLPVLAVHILNQSLEGHIVDALSSLALVAHLQDFPPGSVNQDVVNLLGVIPKRCVQAEMVLLHPVSYTHLVNNDEAI